MAMPTGSRNRGATTASSAPAQGAMRKAAAGSTRGHPQGLVTEGALEDEGIWGAVADAVGALMADGRADEVGALDGTVETEVTVAAVTVAAGGRMVDTGAGAAHRVYALQRTEAYFCGGLPP